MSTLENTKLKRSVSYVRLNTFIVAMTQEYSLGALYGHCACLKNTQTCVKNILVREYNNIIHKISNKYEYNVISKI